MKESYKTIKQSTGTYKEKGSKFMCFLHTAASVEQANSIINIYKEKFHDARHCCTLYKIGDLSRTCDDGEPGQIATRAMYSQIESSGLDNIVCVVVRYFGGILLGTPGLWNAYKTAVKEAIDNGTIEEVDYCDEIVIEVNTPMYNDLMSTIKWSDSKIISYEYDGDCDQHNLKVSVSRKNVNLFKKYEGSKTR